MAGDNENSNSTVILLMWYITQIIALSNSYKMSLNAFTRSNTHLKTL